MYWQNLLFNYQPTAENITKYEICSICGKKEKAGYEYCCRKFFQRELIYWSIPGIGVIVYAFFLILLIGIGYNKWIEDFLYVFLSILCLVFAFKIISWSKKKKNEEKIFITKFPKQKIQT